MPRRPRVQYPGAIYHVMARGNRREPIFLDKEDREIFLETLDEVCSRCGWEVYAWGMMTNHYHIAMRTPEPNLSDGMKWFQNAYTRRFNSRHRAWGRLFGDRYKAELIQTESSRTDLLAHCPALKAGPPPRNEKVRHLRTLIDYIHLNPARARMVEVDPSRASSSVEDGLASYPWSSLVQGYLIPPSKRAAWLVADRGFRFVGHGDDEEGRGNYLQSLERRVYQEQKQSEGIKTGAIDRDDHEYELSILEEQARRWVWGDDEFMELVQEGLLENGEATDLNRNYQSSDTGRDLARRRASSLLKEAAEHFGVRDLASLPKGDQRRAAAAWAVWTQVSGISQRWLAEELGLNQAATVSAQISRFRRVRDEELSESVRAWKQAFAKNP